MTVVAPAESRGMPHRSRRGESGGLARSSIHEHEAGDRQSGHGEQKGEFRFHGLMGIFLLRRVPPSLAGLLNVAAESSTEARPAYSSAGHIFLSRVRLGKQMTGSTYECGEPARAVNMN